MNEFKIGDIVKVIKSGCGMHPDQVGLICKIKEVGHSYYSNPGVVITHLNGTPVKKYSSQDCVGVESFELYKSSLDKLFENLGSLNKLIETKQKQEQND